MNPAMANQYRTHYQQPMQQSPHVRRGKGANSAASQEQARLERQRQELALAQQRAQELELDYRRARQPTDVTIPEGVDALVIGDGVEQYKRLQAVERRLDGIMMRRRLDAENPVKGGSALIGGVPPRMKRVKVWISNTVENQPWQGGGMEESAFDFNTGVEASYRVKIEGKVIDDGGENDDEDDDGENDGEKNGDAMDTTGGDGGDDTKAKQEKFQAPPQRKKTKLSHFFKSITVDFDRNKNLQPEGMTQVEWKKPKVAEGAPLPASADFDTLEFERKSDENINCKINFYREEHPERFLLDEPLAQLLDTREDDMDSILIGIWEYIKAKDLQQEDEKRQITCDDMMKAVFNIDTLYFPYIPSMLQAHVSPAPPLSIPYTIRVDPEYHSLPTQQRYTIYTLDVPVASDPPKLLPPVIREDLPLLRQKNLDLAVLVQAINKSQRKHTFLTQLSADPVTFTKRWMASQQKDLAVLLGEDGRFEDGRDLSEEWTRGGDGGVWGSRKVKEAVQLMVEKPDRSGRSF